jgi:hypothetical protein
VYYGGKHMSDLDESRKRKRIPKYIKNLAWKKHIGLGHEGKCYCCGSTITLFNFQVGHNIALVKGGTDNIENLIPICAGCNNAMGTDSIEEFKKRHWGGTESTPETKPSYRCDYCKELISEKDYLLSTDRHGKPLCQTHQDWAL